MKTIKYKSLIITCIVCLLPILFGVALWDKLPEMIAIHFDFNNNPDNFAPKAFAVYGLPSMMVLLQIICCVIFDANAKKYGERIKFERVVKWIIPVMSIVLQAATLGFAMGKNVDARRVAVLIVGAIFIVMGNYMPKFDRIKNYNEDAQKAKKINRFIGFEMVILGILMLISLFFKPIASVICLLLLIPYAIISVIYAIVVIKRK